MRIEEQFELSKFSTVERKIIALRIFRQKGPPSEEHHFQLHHVSASRKCFFLLSPNDLVLPVTLNKLRIGQEVELREITQGEERYSHALEILNRPISWWQDQTGFETMLGAMRLKPITPLPLPDGDQIDNFFDAEQRRAIAAALDYNRSFVVIHGPRGSGKTLVTAEMISKVIFLKLPKMKNSEKLVR